MIPEASISQAWGAPPQANDGQYNLAGTTPENVQAQIAKFGEQQAEVIGTTPVLVDLAKYTGGTNPKFLDQGISLEIDARDARVYVRFRGDNGAPATTPLNGRRIEAAASDVPPTVFWIPGGTMYRYMDIVSSAPNTNVVWRRSSEPRIRG